MSFYPLYDEISVDMPLSVQLKKEAREESNAPWEMHLWVSLSAMQE